MPPRKTAAKPSGAKSATASAVASAKKTAAPAKANMASKRKRASDEEPVQAKKPRTASKPAVKKAETPAPPATANGVKKRAKSATPAPTPAPTKTKAKTAAKPKAAATKAKAAVAKPKKAPTKAAVAAAKRKATEEAEDEEEAKSDDDDADDDAAVAAPPPAKKRAVTPKAAPAPPKPKPIAKIGVKINSAPTQALDVFVFGEGSAGELGLGAVRVDGKKPVDVRRPRLNANLAAATVGVVQLAAGGMHAVALTKDNKILTWGVNDQGALGRDTTWSGGLRDADADSDSEDEDDSGLNPRESTPGEIDLAGVQEGTKFVQVVASDSASFALSEDGRVYGWGTFRASDGILGFSRDVDIQRTPVLLPEPKKIRVLATGSNHILALDNKGKLYTWGCPEQNQLGRRCVQRDIKSSALRPGGVGFRRGVHIEKIACGSYHSFALDAEGRVYAWGLNNFGQLNVGQGAGDSDATVLDATLMEGLEDHKIAEIDGGEHHSLACTTDGQVLAWGRIDGHQVGLPDAAFTEENAIFDERGKPRILKTPTRVGDLPDTVTSVAAGTDNNFALTSDGKAYSWGFSANYQTGQGTTDDVETPELIDNTAVRSKKLVYAGAGGQFSLLASVAEE